MKASSMTMVGGPRVPKRTVFAAFYTASPPTGGASAVTHQLACHWPGERLLVQIGTKAGRWEIAPGLHQQNLRQAGNGSKLYKLLQVPGWCRRISRLAAEFNADTIMLEGASWIVFHWWLLVLLRRAAPRARIVYHSHNVEYDLRRKRRSWLIAWLTRLAEGYVVRQVDIVTAVSAIDASHFNTLYGRLPMVLPNGVDLNWVRNVSQQVIERVRQHHSLPKETVLFMGSYDYLPNAEAIEFLVSKVFPKVVEAMPLARLLVLGGPVPYREDWLVTPGLVPVEDLPAYIATAAVSVAPIFSGSGTRLKIVESLGAGIPVVATAKGAEGLPVTDDWELDIAETADEFVSALTARLGSVGQVGRHEPFPSVERLSWPRIVEEAMLSLEATG